MLNILESLVLGISIFFPFFAANYKLVVPHHQTGCDASFSSML